MSFIRKKYDYPEGGSGNGIRAAAEKGERFQTDKTGEQAFERFIAQVR